MSANRVLLLAIAFGMALIGLGMQRGEMIALALPLLAYLAVGLWYAPAPTIKVTELDDPKVIERRRAQELSSRKGIEALNFARTLAQRNVRPDQPVKLDLSLENTGADFDELALAGGLPAGVGVVDGPTAALIPLPPGASAHWQQTVQARRGEYNFPTLRIEVRETLGLFGTSGELPAVSSTRLIVEPTGEALRPFMLRPPQTRGFAGPVPARQGGRGTDFFTVREYQPGDSLRQINWKASSRAPRALYTNIFEQQRIADVGIILDARQHSELHTKQGSLFEHSVRAAATLTEPILKSGNRLGLLVYGPGMESVFPGYGKVQQRRISRALSRAGAGHNYALESLAHLPTRFFPAGSQIILISSLQPEDPPLVAHLVVLGYAVIVISPDPLTFEHPDANPADPAWRLACVERHFQLQRLERAGVRVVDWDVRQPLAALFQRVLRRR
jgi:uncharacterized protein (DUF58 family)